ncbi:MAG: hypothetical protein WBW33_24675, partial [Bryobacteraceae bacterium]
APVCAQHQGYPTGVAYQLRVKLQGMHRETHGWKATGHVGCRCIGCASAAMVLRNQIPIQAHDFKCPKCGQSEELEYLIDEIKEGEDMDKLGFQFEVFIQCKKCKRRRSIKTFIENILSRIKLEMKPDGSITVNAG